MTKKSKRGRKPRRKAKVDGGERASVNQQDRLESKMQRLQIGNEDDLLEEAIKLAAAEEKAAVVAATPMQERESKARSELNLPECRHGNDIRDSRIDDFLGVLLHAFEEARRSRRSIDQVMDYVCTATERFMDVWSNSIKTKLAISALLAAGTDFFLIDPQGKNGHQFLAFLASFLEQHIDVNIFKTKAHFDFKLLTDLENGDAHTIASFLRRRIPCSCLDEVYNEVKSMKKKGRCWNVNCTKNGIVNRSSLMCCARCNSACYCSVECQKEAWPSHKQQCDRVFVREEAFKKEKSHSN